MLSNKAALDRALSIFNESRVPEQKRLDRIDAALQPKLGEDGLPLPRMELPDDAPEILTRLTTEAETNYLPLALDTYAQVLRVDGYITEVGDGRDPWTAWQRNRMDARQTPLHRATLAYGTGYATALPGVDGFGDPFPTARIYSPRNMTAMYEDREWDDWPVDALVVHGDRWELITDEAVYTFMVEKRAPIQGGLGTYSAGRLLTPSTPAQHSLGVAPVVKYHDRHYLSDERAEGIIEPLMTVQKRIDRTSANQMIAQQVAIFKQRYVVGWVPESEEEEFKANLARVHYLDMDPSEVEFGEWEGTPIEPYIVGGNQARRDFAALGQLPAQTTGLDGISNISDATLAGLEAAKNRRAGVMTTSLGESHEQLMRLFAYIDGNDTAARDFSSEVLWRDFESRSFGAQVDGLGKLVSMGLPPEIAMEDVPGMSGQKLLRVQRAMRREQGRRVLQDLRDRAATPPLPTPSDAPGAPDAGALGPQNTPEGDTEGGE